MKEKQYVTVFFLFLFFSSCINTNSSTKFKKPRERVDEQLKAEIDQTKKTDPNAKKTDSNAKKTDSEKKKSEKEDSSEDKSCSGEITGRCLFQIGEKKMLLQAKENSLLSAKPRCLEVFMVKEDDQKVKIDNAKFGIMHKTEIDREKKVLEEGGTLIMTTYSMDVRLSFNDLQPLDKNIICQRKNIIKDAF